MQPVLAAGGAATARPLAEPPAGGGAASLAQREATLARDPDAGQRGTWGSSQARDERHRGRVSEAVEENQQEWHTCPVVLFHGEDDCAEEIDGEENLVGEREVAVRTVLLASPIAAARFESELRRPREIRLAVRQRLEHRVDVVQ